MSDILVSNKRILPDEIKRCQEKGEYLNYSEDYHVRLLLRSIEKPEKLKKIIASIFAIPESVEYQAKVSKPWIRLDLEEEIHSSVLSFLSYDHPKVFKKLLALKLPQISYWLKKVKLKDPKDSIHENPAYKKLKIHWIRPRYYDYKTKPWTDVVQDYVEAMGRELFKSYRGIASKEYLEKRMLPVSKRNTIDAPDSEDIEGRIFDASVFAHRDIYGGCYIHHYKKARLFQLKQNLGLPDEYELPPGIWGGELLRLDDGSGILLAISDRAIDCIAKVQAYKKKFLEALWPIDVIQRSLSTPEARQNYDAGKPVFWQVIQLTFDQFKVDLKLETGKIVWHEEVKLNDSERPKIKVDEFTLKLQNRVISEDSENIQLVVKIED